MSKAVIICAGSIEDYSSARAEIGDEDFVICADGGLRHAAKMGVSPNVIVGDFDSYGAVPEGENVVVFPCEKDYSDTYMAALEAEKRGYKELLFLGATGTRLDHVMANLALLEVLRRRGTRAAIKDGHNLIFAAGNRETVAGKAGTTVSLLPIYPVKGITLRGFKYPLNNAEIELVDPIWISNELLGGEAEISFESGALLVDIAND
ncbi:MAG: thiamine diphosphokinase [Oscillospiraceae bacterium]|nr:thiamine diphosphokinase [Oscillospiraceae bacterium]